MYILIVLIRKSVDQIRLTFNRDVISQFVFVNSHIIVLPTFIQSVSSQIDYNHIIP